MLKPVRVQEINKQTVPDRQPKKFKGIEVETKYDEKRPRLLKNTTDYDKLVEAKK